MLKTLEIALNGWHGYGVDEVRPFMDLETLRGMSFGLDGVFKEAADMAEWKPSILDCIGLNLHVRRWRELGAAEKEPRE